MAQEALVFENRTARKDLFRNQNSLRHKIPITSRPCPTVREVHCASNYGYIQAVDIPQVETTRDHAHSGGGGCFGDDSPSSQNELVEVLVRDDRRESRRFD